MKFLKQIKSWKKFPSLDTLGYYSPLGNYIYLEQYTDENDFAKAHENPITDRNRYSVFVHEYQHYIDHVSTLWGAENVFKIFRAFDAVLKQDEHKFFNYRELHLNMKRNYFLDYYTENYKIAPVGNVRQWKFQITTGTRFDHNGKVNEEWPIPFVVFKNLDDSRICRVPISTASLLETTATAAEYDFQNYAIGTLEPAFKEIQLSALYQKIEKKLYNPELALYSAAVHVTSAYLQITDRILAYRLSSVFAKIALNIPSSEFKNLIIPKNKDETPGSEPRRLKLVANLDRGYAFCVLILNYVAKYGPSGNSEIELEDILSASNLPDEKKMQDIINAEILKMNQDTILQRNDFSRMITDKIYFGKKFREQTGIGQTNEAGDLSEFIREMPHIIYNSTLFDYEDLELAPIFLKSVKQEVLTLEEWFRLSTYCEKEIDDFNKICGI